MGQSTNAILAFGVDLGEGVDDDWENILPWRTVEEDDDDPETFEEWIYKLNGLSTEALWGEYAKWAEAQPDLGTYDARMTAWEALRPDWRPAKEALFDKQAAALEACPIEVVTHCHHEESMYVVAVRGTVTTAHRGSPEKIDPADLDLLDLYVHNAEQFCDEHNIPFEDPTWLLFSYWN